MERKSFIDIENIRETDIELNGNITRRNNVSGFKPGDLISITTKLDGSNASIRYNKDTKELVAFSRKQELSFGNTLCGFWDYVQQLNKSIDFSIYPNFVIFGEWMSNSKRQNKITYDRTFQWVVYSIWDDNKKEWQSQKIVKDFCIENHLEYIEELYYGPFISWEHCRSFLHSSKYGPIQEGVVIRNETIMNQDKNRCNHVIKIVNTEFAESMIKVKRELSPEEIAEKENADKLIQQIVTKNRVEKILGKLQMNGDLPKEITPEMMGQVAKKLSKAVHEDVIKEEPEVMRACGKYGGKFCATYAMKYARELILGS